MTRKFLTYLDVLPASGVAVAPVAPLVEMDAVEFARTRLGFEPDEKQAEVLRSDAKRGMLNCSRQWGKSTVTAAKAVHRAYTRPKSLVLVASVCLRQSGEFLRKAEEMLLKLGIKPRRDGYNDLSILLPNGSRIIALPGNEANIRGYSGVSLMIIDEAARVGDAMYRAMRPMLAVGGGDLWLISTPWGRQGFFYEEWTHGGPDWARWSVKATECSRIPKEFLEEERRSMGTCFEREYMCTFVDTGAGTFDRDMVEAALDWDLPTLGLD